jgi:hypothetical protein
VTQIKWIPVSATLVWLPCHQSVRHAGNSGSCLGVTDRLCGPVIRVPDYRFRGPGFGSRPYQIFLTCRVCNGVHSASWVQLRSYLKEIVAAPV